MSDLKRMRELEAENAKLKRMYADLALENAAIKVPVPKTVTPSAKQQVAETLVKDHRLPIRRACQIVRLSRAAFYRTPQGSMERDREVIEALNRLVGANGRWGFWKCYDRLRLNGHRWNHKRVHRVYCGLKLNLPRRTRRRVPQRVRQPLAAPVMPNRPTASKKDMIISGGFNVYPSEVEQVLWGHPAVQDCAVIDGPDEKWGEAVEAVVELRAGRHAGADELIGSVKAPKSVEFVDTLPRSPVGTVLKKGPRARYWQGTTRRI